MRVIISIGHGRLHLLSSAYWISKAGVSVRLLCGWVPKKPNGLLVRIASRLVGRDLSAGFRKRVLAQPNYDVCSCAYAEIVDQMLRLLCRALGIPPRRIAGLGWRLFGFQSRFFIEDAAIFHVRSGAGQGGAIRKAKRLGMKIVCDHSIAHPSFMDKQLRAEYQRNGVIFDLGLDSPLWQQVIKDCEEADVVMVNSFFVKKTFVENGFPAKKVKVVYLGQREDFAGLRHPKFTGTEANAPLRLLFTGGFGFRKGGEYILEAMKILADRRVPFEMDVVGAYLSAGNLISRYKDVLNIGCKGQVQPQVSAEMSHTIPCRIVFHGPKPQEELKTFLSAGDIYVFPSLAEGCAQSGMEAMSAGLCVIGTQESGFPITDGENGFIVPGKNAQAIADRIEWLNKNRATIDRVGANAARLIQEKYTWPQYAENVKGLYEELLGNGKQAR